MRKFKLVRTAVAIAAVFIAQVGLAATAADTSGLRYRLLSPDAPALLSVGTERQAIMDGLGAGLVHELGLSVVPGVYAALTAGTVRLRSLDELFDEGPHAVRGWVVRVQVPVMREYTADAGLHSLMAYAGYGRLGWQDKPSYEIDVYESAEAAPVPGVREAVRVEGGLAFRQNNWTAGLRLQPKRWCYLDVGVSWRKERYRIEATQEFRTRRFRNSPGEVTPASGLGELLGGLNGDRGSIAPNIDNGGWRLVPRLRLGVSW